MGTAIGRSRFVLLACSCAATTVAVGLIIAALFSVSFRTVDVPYLQGKKYFGLFRYCWEPYIMATGGIPGVGFPGGPGVIHQQSSINAGISCYIRSAGFEQPRIGTIPGSNSNEYMFEFEKTTLVLLVVALVLAVMAICFALCTLFSELCALAHATLILAANVSCAAGFGVYTYNNEQPDLLGENDKGQMLPYHYGWGYYHTGIATLMLFLAFMISILAASVFFYHKRRHSARNSHIRRTTVKL